MIKDTTYSLRLNKLQKSAYEAQAMTQGLSLSAWIERALDKTACAENGVDVPINHPRASDKTSKASNSTGLKKKTKPLPDIVKIQADAAKTLEAAAAKIEKPVVIPSSPPVRKERPFVCLLKQK